MISFSLSGLVHFIFTLLAPGLILIFCILLGATGVLSSTVSVDSSLYVSLFHSESTSITSIEYSHEYDGATMLAL